MKTQTLRFLLLSALIYSLLAPSTSVQAGQVVAAPYPEGVKPPLPEHRPLPS